MIARDTSQEDQRLPRSGEGAISTILPLLRVLWRSFLLHTKEQLVGHSYVGLLLVQPVLFTLISVGTYLYGGKAELGLYAVMGTAIIGIWNSNLWASGRIIERERRSGLLMLLIASPTSMLVILFGKSLSNAVISLLALVVTFLTALLVFRLPITILHPLSFVLGLVLTLFAMTWLGIIFGSLFVLTRNATRFMEAANYPIFLLSGLTFPLTLLPPWLRPLSALLAPTWGNLALTQAAGLRVVPQEGVYLWLVGLSLLYALLARVLFERVVFLVRDAGNLEEW